MPKTEPNINPVFNEPYEALSTLKSDGFSVPHLNASETLAIFPGEPILKAQGDDPIVCLAQSLIRPGEWKSVLRYWNAIFPCNFSDTVEDGDDVFWDIDDEVCKLEGDVTNGFLLGAATFSVEPGETLISGADDRAVVALDSSTFVQVVCRIGTSSVIGTVGNFSEASV